MAEIPGYPVPREHWTDAGEKCAKCYKKFTLFTVKKNCPFCGNLCCTHCIAAECTIFPGHLPSKVCRDCFAMIQDHRRGVTDQEENDTLERPRPHTATSSEVLNRCGEPTQSPPVVKPLFSSTTEEPERMTESMLTIDYVKKLLKKSENLRLENVDWLNRSKQYESEICTLREVVDRTNAELTVKGKIIDQYIVTQCEKESHIQSLVSELNNASQSLVILSEVKEREKLESRAALEFASQIEAKFFLFRSEYLRHNDPLLHEADDINVSAVLETNEVSQGEARSSTCVTERCSQSRSASHGAFAGLRELPASLVPDTDLTLVPPVPSPAAVEGLRAWRFDSFAAAERVPSLLQSVAGDVAAQWALFPAHSESARCWARLVAVVENNYLPNPYHNAIHAADVLQGLFALVSAAGPALSERLTLIERRAAAFAAIVHDVRHPGRTSAFLAAVGDPVCVRYVWRGALEQLHTATGFEILAVPELDFTRADMDTASFVEFKSIVTALIARTDMSLHNDCLACWGARAGGGGFDMARPADRVEALALLLHAADIGAAARGVPTALKWLVVLDEFAQQAADERQRGLPVTPGFDRPPSVERAQIGFLDAIVIPTFYLVRMLFPQVQEPVENLRALRGVYAAAADITTPFPPPKDYVDPAIRLHELESVVAESRKRDTVARQCVGDVRSALDALRERTAALQTRESTSAEREEFLHIREQQLAMMSERLAAVAESFERVKRCSQSLVLREASMRAAELVSERERILHQELEERLVVRSAEVDDLLVIVRGVRAHREGKWHELNVKAVKHEAIASPYVEKLRTRSLAVDQIEGQHFDEPSEVVGRLESAVEQLNSAITKLVDEDETV